jgi:hypothetical protein
VVTLAFVPPLLRYGVHELLLVQPLLAGFWRAPETPWEGPWPPEDGRPVTLLESADRAFRDRLTREPRTATAPAPWPVEIALLGVDALTGSVVRRSGWPSELWTIGPAGRALVALGGLRTMAERTAARRLGVVAATAPRPRMVDLLLVTVPVLIVPDLVRNARGLGSYPVPPLHYETARTLVRAFNGRRSWRRAYAAARASQDLSSASSSTSAVCAPDTP